MIFFDRLNRFVASAARSRQRLWVILFLLALLPALVVGLCTINVVFPVLVGAIGVALVLSVYLARVLYSSWQASIEESPEDPSMTSHLGVMNTGQLDALNAVLGAITSSLDMSDVIHNTLHVLTQVTKAIDAAVFFYEPNLNQIQYAGSLAFPKQLIAALDHESVDQFFAKEALEKKRILKINNLRHVESFVNLRLDELRPNWQSFLCIPLYDGKQTGGVLIVVSEKPETFDKTDQELFGKVGLQLARSLSNVRTHEELRNQAITDGLTGAYNRRFLDDFLEIEVQRGARYTRPVSVLMLDIDFFKLCNDRAGHQAGDQALIDLVQLLNIGIRNIDLVARYGGEEFAVVLPETDSKGALEVAERMRSLIENHEFSCGKLTASFGVAEASFQGDDNPTPEVLVQRADTALMRSKAMGRNRVTLWGSE